MSGSVVEKWGKDFAIRVPADVARTIGLSDGEMIEVEAQDGDLIIRRRALHAFVGHDAPAAAAEIIADSHRHSLPGVSIQTLLDKGRRR